MCADRQIGERLSRVRSLRRVRRRPYSYALGIKQFSRLDRPSCWGLGRSCRLVSQKRVQVSSQNPTTTADHCGGEFAAADTTEHPPPNRADVHTQLFGDFCEGLAVIQIDGGHSSFLNIDYGESLLRELFVRFFSIETIPRTIWQLVSNSGDP